MAETRLYTLDAVRGVAALIVAGSHAVSAMGTLRPLHSSVSVDLFFVMSGFVLERAYAAKLARGMTTGEFMILRYIRLYPVYLLAILLAILGGAGAMLSGRGTFDSLTFTTASIAALLLLPSPTMSTAESISPLNKSAWSLIFELAANVVYAAWYRHLTMRVLCVIIGVSAVWLFANTRIYGDFLGGFGWSNIPRGIARVSFSFFAGVALSRIVPSRQVITSWAWLIPGSFVLLQCIAIRILPNVYVDLLIVLLGCPLLVALGAIYQPRRAAFFEALGDISYPIYVLHVPVFDLAWRCIHMIHLQPKDIAPWFGLGLLAALSATSLVLDRLYDRPVRRWLAGVVRNRQTASALRPARDAGISQAGPASGAL